MTEAELQQAVIECAHVFGWRVAHFRPAQTTRGWRTPVAADGKGFPDLVLVRGEHVAFVELKAGRNKLSLDQVAWMDALEPTCVLVDVWTERDWLSGHVERALKDPMRFEDVRAA